MAPDRDVRRPYHAAMATIQEAYLRSALFGLQDGIVSTTGVVAGISAGVDDRTIVILAAFVAVTVEASSMAAGQYTSEKAAHQLRGGEHTDSLVLGALIMFASYFLSGMVPVVPTVLLAQPTARYTSVGAAFVALFVVGYIKGKIVGSAPLRSALELLTIGGIATLIGLAVGFLLKV